MKRSKVNEIIKARIKISSLYCGFMPEDGTMPNFDMKGCYCCRDGADNVYMVDAVNMVTGTHKLFHLCNECVCALVNADNSALDYCVDDEDEPVFCP